MAKADTTKSSVKIVDSKLILSLPDAKEPVVWQMDLEKARSAAFTVKENAETKTFSLVLKEPGGTAEEIAPFDDKKSATAILMETAQVLQNAHGKIKPQTQTAQANERHSMLKTGGEKGDKLGAILAMILAILLILVWIMASSATHRYKEDGSNTGMQTTAGSVNPRSSSGVAVSADDFLSNR